MVKRKGITITNHAYKRLKQRCGFNKNMALKVSNRAFNLGLRHCDIVGNLGKWVDGVYLAHRNANNLRVYKNHVYLFQGNNLITVMEIPQGLFGELKELEEKLGKNKVVK